MKKLITILALSLSLSATAQTDTTKYVLKADLNFFNALLESLNKLKSLYVFAESPFKNVDLIDKLSADIKQQIEKQIRDLQTKSEPKKQ